MSATYGCSQNSPHMIADIQTKKQGYNKGYQDIRFGNMNFRLKMTKNGKNFAFIRGLMRSRMRL